MKLCIYTHSFDKFGIWLLAVYLIDFLIPFPKLRKVFFIPCFIPLKDFFILSRLELEPGTVVDSSCIYENEFADLNMNYKTKANCK